jgi:hypothetical protein
VQVADVVAALERIAPLERRGGERPARDRMPA